MKNIVTCLFAKILFPVALMAGFVPVATAQNTLDKLSLTSGLPAAGAYSLRQLSSTYAGPLVRINIGGSYYDVYPDGSTGQTFSLSSPISAAYADINAASTGATANTLSSVATGMTATVAIWYDQSGNGYNGVQANSSNQPEIINGGTIDLAGNLPAVKFSGGKWLVVTSTGFDGDLSGSVVYNATTANTSNGPTSGWWQMNGIFGSEQPGPVTDFGYGIYNGKFSAGNGSPVDFDMLGNATVTDGTMRIGSWTRANNTGIISLYASGLPDGSATLSTGQRVAVSSIAIGAITTQGSVTFNGTISEMALFPAVYSSNQRSTVEGNQMAYYGITSPLSDATLTGLSTSQGTLSPAFSRPTTAYTETLGGNVPVLTVTATPFNPASAVTINGTTGTTATIAINPGANVITIAVTSQDGTATQTYTITVTGQTPNILDKAGLGGNAPALAAYSLRKLSSTYTGSAIQVTRSSDNTTQDIGFTPAGDLDVNALTTFAGPGNAYVSTWYDQSGNGNDARPNTSGGMGPLIVNAGTVFTSNNNLPCAYFGVPGPVLRSPASFSPATPFTMNCVAAANNGTVVTLSGADGVAQNSCLGAGRFAGEGAGWFGGWGEDDTFVAGAATNAEGIRTKTYTPGTITGYFNSDNIFSANITYNLTAGDILLGAQDDQNNFQLLNGTASEVAVFTQTFSAADQRALEGNQANYYGIARNLSPDATLSALTISTGTLSPAFAPATNSYTATVAHSATSLTVTATPNNNSATITINGTVERTETITLNPGVNNITIAVTSQDGSTVNNYTLAVTVPPLNALDKAGLGNTALPLAAYSLRRLSSTYTGYAIRVSRTSDNTTQDIGFTPAGDLDTAALKTFVGADNGYITVWYDQGGNQSNAGLLYNFLTGPQIVNNGVINTLNNRPCAVFSSPYTSLNAAAAFDGLTPFTMNAVSAANNGSIVSLSGNIGAGVNATLGISEETGTAGWFGGWGEDYSYNAGTYRPGQSVLTKTYSSGTITGYVNGQNIFTSSTTYNLTDQHILIGITDNYYDQPLTGPASEITLFASTLSDADRQALENNQSVYYGAQSFPTAVSSIKVQGNTITNAANVNYTVSFKNPVSGLTAGNFTLTSQGISADTVGTPNSADGGLIWTVPVFTGSGDGSLALVLDNATGIGNTITSALPFAGDTVIVDKTPPAISVSAPSVSGVTGNGLNSVTYTITYSDADFNASNLTATGIVLNTTGTANGVITVSGSGTVYTVDITNITGAGTIGISVGGGYATDHAGNTDAGASLSATVDVLPGNADLASINPQYRPMSPQFRPHAFSYNLTVANTVKTIWFAPVTADPNATLTLNGVSLPSGTPSTSVTLAEGVTTTVTIVVTAPGGVTTRTYTIHVTRTASSDATLSAVGSQYGPLSPLFTPAVNTYTLSVPNAKSTMTVTPVATDPNATITVNGTAVTPGTASAPVALAAGTVTDINIVVTAQGGNSQTYTLAVTRGLSSDATLTSMGPQYGPLSPIFQPGITSYVISVSNNKTTFTVTPVTSDPNAAITVNGNPVASGSISSPVSLTAGATTPIAVKVTAQDGTSKTYTIQITRLSDVNLVALGAQYGPLSPFF